VRARPVWLLLPARLGLSEQALAQAALPAITSAPAPGGGQIYSLTVHTLLLLTSLAFLPALVLTMTSFTRIIIVLSLLRQALGTVQAPPNQVLIGLSLFLTFFVMAPVFDRCTASRTLLGAPEFNDALSAPLPLKGFMRARPASRTWRCSRASPGAATAEPDQVPMKILVPAYVISELKTAFQIGFVVFIPFLIIDLVVSSVLMSMGMMMLSPVIISLPFKLMLFVLVDGWNLLVGSLVQSF
jgi:flagellar biosynthetic protein FliP